MVLSRGLVSLFPQREWPTQENGVKRRWISWKGVTDSNKNISDQFILSIDTIYNFQTWAFIKTSLQRLDDTSQSSDFLIFAIS